MIPLTMFNGLRLPLKRWLALALLGLCALPVRASALPPEVVQALARARVPPEAMAVVVQEVGGTPLRLGLNATRPLNPASLIKLATTYAALETLGPAWAWRTPVWLHGRVNDGVLDGSLVIKGTGDPKLTVERVWLLLRRVQQLGVREIHGDIVLDRSAFDVPEVNAGEFDGEPLRPYNVRADALLLNFKAVTYQFTPDEARGIAVVGSDPVLRGVQVDTHVPLANGGCDDWRAALKANFTEPTRVRFAGSYAAACGERSWPVAHGDAGRYNARLLEAMWRELGGTLGGTVRDGTAPTDRAPTFEFTSPPLAEVVRDINKFSNNMMAQQLFLSLALVPPATVTPDIAREHLRRWLAERLGESMDGVVIDNGSGLSRETRVSAGLLARLLQAAWASPVMPELMASLPVNGVDGTLRRSRAQLGRAHLKTGSLRDVVGVAGYVLGASGKRYVLVALINHANANAARPAIDALVQWTLADTGRR